MFKLAYTLGCYEALMKLGATSVMPELSPAQRAYMQRMTEFNAPTAALPPQLRQPQRQWKHVAQTKVPELIGASEDYMKKRKEGRNPGEGLTPEGVRRARAQRQTMEPWLQSKGQQIVNAPEFAAPATPAAVGTEVASPSAKRKADQLAKGIRQELGTADTALNIVARKPRPGIQFAKTLARRFAHV